MTSVDTLWWFEEGLCEYKCTQCGGGLLSVVKRRLTPPMAVVTSKYTYITPKWR